MKNIILFIALILLFSGCSFKSPDNAWQLKSSSAFESYTKNFLYGYINLAKNDLDRAVKHAKMSSDFTTLARIYLGECALNISVGIQDECENYITISEVVQDKYLDAYYAFITSTLEKKQIVFLPEIYQEFALTLQNLDINSASKEILKMNKITSKLLSAAIIKDKLSITTIQSILKSASFHGYKRIVIYWLKILQEKTIDKNEKKIIIKKLSVLESV